jgi:hypothetical protein
LAQAQSSPGKQTGLTNPGFEEPRGKEARFSFAPTMPGWKTTDKEFEIWGSGFEGVVAHEGSQFVELNAWIDGTLYQDSKGIQPGSLLEFTFAHRGRSGKDTMKLTIIDLGADNALGGGDDTVLFTKQYTTGKEAWAVYDSTKEKQIKALGNTVRFAYGAISSAGGSIGAGNFLDAANFGVGVVSMDLTQKPQDLSGEYVISAKAVEGDCLAIWTYGNIVAYVGPEQTWTLKKLSDDGEKRIYSLAQKGQYLSVKDGKLVPSKTPGQWVVWDNGGAYSIMWYEDATKGANCLSLIKKGDGYAPLLAGHAHYSLELARNNGGKGNAHQLWELTKGLKANAPAAAAPSPSSYKAQVQWGGPSAPWQEPAVWVIGGRKDQAVVGLDIKSTDGGKTLTGTMTYAGEGPIRLKAVMNPKQPNYKAQVQWGAESSPWVDQGSWVVGGRKDQSVIALQIKSADGGKTLTGTTTYAGEQPIAFKAEIAK